MTAPPTHRRRATRISVLLPTLLSMVIGLIGFAALPASAGVVNSTLNVEYTGTGHGTTSACAINTANGFTPADDSATDSYVCANDVVGYRYDYNVDTSADTGPTTYAVSITDPTLAAAFRTAVCTGAAATAPWSATSWNAATRTCTFTMKPGLTESGAISFSLTAPKSSSPETQTASTIINGGMAAVSGGTAVGAPNVTVLEIINTDAWATAVSPRMTTYQGQMGVAFDLSGNVSSRTYAGYSVSKGYSLSTSKSALTGVVTYDLAAADPGWVATCTTDVNPCTVNGTRVTMPANSNAATTPTLTIFYPYDYSATTPTTVDVTAQIIATGVTDAGVRMNGVLVRQQIGEGQPCSFNTTTAGGSTAVGGLPNNDCTTSSFTYDPAGERYVKVDSPDGSSGQALVADTPFNATLSVAIAPVIATDFSVCMTVNTNGSMLDSSTAIRVVGGPLAGKTPIIQYRAGALVTTADGVAGACGNVPDASGWFTDPNAVPGGVAAITEIRFTFPGTTDLFNATGPSSIVVPMKTLDASHYPLAGFNGPYTNFMTITDNGTTATTAWNGTSSDQIRVSGYKLTFFARKTVAAGDAQGRPGGTVKYAASGRIDRFNTALPVNGTLTTTITDTMSPCVGRPTFDATSLQIWTITSITPPNLGADGIPCTGDAGETGWSFTATKTGPNSDPLYSGSVENTSGISGELRYTAQVLPNAAPSSTITNSINVAMTGSGVGTQPAPRIATAVWTVPLDTTVGTVKTVSDPRVPTETPFSWTLYLYNNSATTAGRTQWIDVFPYNGDANGSHFNGTRPITGITATAGVVIEYSKTAPASIANDPAAASNQTGGSTVWCTALSGGACPANYGEVTAIRMTIANFAADTRNAVVVNVDPTGNRQDDLYVNRLSEGRASGLGLPIPSPAPVNTIVYAAQIGDFVWLDANANGIQDTGEAGVPGVTVHLLDAGGNELARTTTDANGKYIFPGLNAGTYSVTFDAPAGMQFTAQAAGTNRATDSNPDATGASPQVTLAADGSNLTVDAGLVPLPTANLGDYVWSDNDRDGIQDAGEPGIAGVTVRLLDSAGTQVASTTTDANGKYAFTGVAPGTYTVNFTTPTGYSGASPQAAGADRTVDSDIGATGSVTVTLAAGETNNTIDAGFTPALASLQVVVCFQTQNCATPMEGLDVTVASAPGSTDATGTFRVDDLTPNTDYPVGATIPDWSYITDVYVDGVRVGDTIPANATTPDSGVGEVRIVIDVKPNSPTAPNPDSPVFESGV